jgi:hypothetical protein
MYSLSFDVAEFEKYALPQVSGQYVMPDDRTVVSIDKDGNPVSYFEDDIWDFNAFFNLPCVTARLSRPKSKNRCVALTQ